MALFMDIEADMRILNRKLYKMTLHDNSALNEVEIDATNVDDEENRYSLSLSYEQLEFYYPGKDGRFEWIVSRLYLSNSHGQPKLRLRTDQARPISAPPHPERCRKASKKSKLPERPDSAPMIRGKVLPSNPFSSFPTCQPHAIPSEGVMHVDPQFEEARARRSYADEVGSPLFWANQEDILADLWNRTLSDTPPRDSGTTSSETDSTPPSEASAGEASSTSSGEFSVRSRDVGDNFVDQDMTTALSRDALFRHYEGKAESKSEESRKKEPQFEVHYREVATSSGSISSGSTSSGSRLREALDKHCSATSAPLCPRSSEDPCILCFERVKDAVMIHGGTGHQACCMQCALKLKSLGHPCPICREPILAVVKNYGC